MTEFSITKHGLARLFTLLGIILLFYINILGDGIAAQQVKSLLGPHIP